MVGGDDGRSGFPPASAVCRTRIVFLIAEEVGFGKPPGVAGLEFVISENVGGNGEPAGTGATVDVLVTSAHDEIEVVPTGDLEVDGEDTEGMVGVEDDASTVVVGGGDDFGDAVNDLPGGEDDMADDDEIRFVGDGGNDVFGVDEGDGTFVERRRDELDVDSILAFVGAEDEIDAVELHRGRNDIDFFLREGVEDGTEGLAHGGFGDDRVGLRMVEKLGDLILVLGNFVEPGFPGIVHLVVPEVGEFLKVGGHSVEGTAEGVVGKIDAGSLSGSGEVLVDELRAFSF